MIGDLESRERGTGARLNDGKPQVDLIPFTALALCFSPSPIVEVLRCVGQFQTASRSPDSKRFLVSAYDALASCPSGRGDTSDVVGLVFDEAAVFAYGAKKYAAWNWAKGMPWSVPIGCIGRHALAMQRKEHLDPESNLPHRGHIACNIRMLMHYTEFYPEGNDLPPDALFQPPT